MTYEAWRVSYQSSEQAARAAFEDACRLRTELEQERKRMDFMLGQECRHISVDGTGIIWYGIDDRKWKETTNPRATIDELMGE